MMRFLISFKHRHPKAWALVEEVNGFLFRLRYGRLEKTASEVLRDGSVAGCGFSVIRVEDLPRLEAFLARQDQDNLRWFHPHPFDGASLKKIMRNPSYLLMKASDPDDNLVGYFFLRGFFIGRAFAGLIVDRDWQNRDIGTWMWQAMAAICSRRGLRMQATISTDNKPSMASCLKGTSVIEQKPLEDGYLAVECKQKPI